MKKFILTLIALCFIALQGFAKTSEFKNILHDLNLSKVSDGTFKVVLKTEIPFTDEVKIVKKSENSYYILLAETYSMVKSARGNGIIKEINVETFPYAEQNYDNGYTKISFLTSRPVDWTINLTAKKASKFPIMDLVRLDKLEEMYKNDNFDYKNAVAQNNIPKLETLVPKQTQKPKEATAKAEAVKVEVVKKETKVEKVEKATNKKQKETISKKAKEEIKIQKEEPTKQEKIVNKVKEAPKPQEAVKKPEVVDEKQKQEETQTIEEVQKPQEPVVKQTDKVQNEPAKEEKKDIKLALKDFYNKNEKAVKLASVILLALILGLHLLGKFIALKNQNKSENPYQYDDEIPQNQEEDGAETISFDNILEASNSEEVQEEPEHKKVEENQYEPIFTPENEDKINEVEWLNENIEQNKEENNLPNEAEIIEESTKLLSDEGKQNLAVKKFKEKARAKASSAPIEATILFKTEIANDRGLYLSEYMGNKVLVGYVDNDIFVLHNFKKTPIKSDEVLFRLSEARAKEDIYYVMVDDKKFLVKSDRTSLQVLQKFF